jgi:hypothetical protein
VDRQANLHESLKIAQSTLGKRRAELWLSAPLADHQRLRQECLKKTRELRDTFRARLCLITKNCDVLRAPPDVKEWKRYLAKSSSAVLDRLSLISALNAVAFQCRKDGTNHVIHTEAGSTCLCPRCGRKGGKSRKRVLKCPGCGFARYRDPAAAYLAGVLTMVRAVGWGLAGAGNATEGGEDAEQDDGDDDAEQDDGDDDAEQDDGADDDEDSLELQFPPDPGGRSGSGTGRRAASPAENPSDRGGFGAGEGEGFLQDVARGWKRAWGGWQGGRQPKVGRVDAVASTSTRVRLTAPPPPTPQGFLSFGDDGIGLLSELTGRGAS